MIISPSAVKFTLGEDLPAAVAPAVGDADLAAAVPPQSARVMILHAAQRLPSSRRAVRRIAGGSAAGARATTVVLL
jgi:hypothetical protein